MNRLPNATTRTPPYDCIFGQTARLPIDKCLETPPATIKGTTDLHQEISNRIASNNKKMKEKYDQKHRTNEREIYVENRALVKRAKPANKLQAVSDGPYLVKGIEGNNITLADSDGNTIQAHKNNIRFFPPDDNATESLGTDRLRPHFPIRTARTKLRSTVSNDL